MRFGVLPRRWFALAVLTLTLAGCASAGAGTGDSTSRARRGSSSSIIGEELVDVSQLDLYEVVNRLRPAWLRPQSRGALPRIIIDGNPQQGGTEILRSMRGADVSELQYMNSSDATTRFGTGFMAGAILVISRRR